LKQHNKNNMNKIVLIGASTGGPSAVTQILRALPADLPAAILLIQHMPQYFIPSFAQRLNDHCELDVKEAEDKDSILPGRVLVAPGGFIMEVVSHHYSKDLTAKIHLRPHTHQSISPSIDLSFSSAAKAFGSDVLGIILTGMGKDGAKGCLEIKQNGGKTIAEDESTCIIFGMSAAAIAARAIDSIIPLDQIAKAILTEVSKSNG
jgi:two-component system chemotaxis response regulator CheB